MTRSDVSLLSDLEEEGRALQAEARTLAEEVEAHDEDYILTAKELEAAERERVEAQACWRSRPLQELNRFQDEQFSAFVKLAEGGVPKDRLKLLQNEAAVATAGTGEVRSELLKKDAVIRKCRTALAREVPEAASLKCNLEARLAETEEESRQAQVDLDIDRRQLQDIADEERQAEAAAQKALQGKKRGVDRMRAQLRHASSEHRQHRERIDPSWRDRFEKQVALRDDKNWQLQRRIAEAATATRAARAASTQAAEELTECRSQLESVLCRRAASLRNCDEYCDMTLAADAEVAGAEVAARMEGHSEALLARRQHEAMAAEQQRRVGPAASTVPAPGKAESVAQETFASWDLADDRLRAEASAVRAEIAHDSRWMQAEMANSIPPWRPPIDLLAAGGAIGI